MVRSLAVRLAVGILAIALVLGVATVIVSPGVAERFLFLPDSRDPGPPPDLEGVAGRTVELRTSDGLRLEAWWYPVGADTPAILLLHGNAGHVGHRTPLARELVARGLSVFLLEYRGYGGNPGRPTIEGVVRDAEAGLDRLGHLVDPTRIVVFGRSVGGAVGLRVLEERDAAGVVLEATFTSLEEIAGAAYRFVPGFVFRRLRGHLDARSAVAELDAPLLVVHGEEDRIVPVKMGRELFGAATGPKEWYAIAGAGHNDTYLVAGDRYFERIASFVERVTAPDSD